MLEGYKILRALDRRGEEPFGIAELAAEAGVREATVRTTLRRESDLLEERGRVDTGRPGAKPKRLALRAGARGRLRQRLAAFDDLSESAGGGDERGGPIPEALLEAGETLLSPGSRDVDRLRREAAIGWLGFDAGKRAAGEAEGELRAELEQRLAVLEAMLGLVELEQRAAAGGSMDPRHAEACRGLFEGLRTGDLDSETQAALAVRLEQSPIGEAVAPPLVQLMLAGAPGEELAAEVVSLLHEQALSVHQVTYSALPPGRHADLAVLVVAEEYGEVDLDALAGESVIVFDVGARRPDLRHDARSHSALYVSAVPELENAIGFARRTGGSWLSAGQRLLGPEREAAREARPKPVPAITSR